MIAFTLGLFFDLTVGFFAYGLTVGFYAYWMGYIDEKGTWKP